MSAGGGVFRITEPEPVRLTGSGPPGLRLPPRPEHQRQANYMDVFDEKTLWFDAFRDEKGRHIILLAPPLLNLEGWFWEGGFFDEGGKRMEFQLRKLSNLHEIWIESEEFQGDVVQFEAEGFARGVEVGRNACETFSDRRALVTMVKDDRLEWVRDWLDFHVRRHGADAAIIYNNNSVTYTSEDLLEAMSGVAGIEVAVVVPWRFPYGPDGGDDMPWDSNFSQPGGLEHAHHRFLAKASAVVLCDIDELIVDAEGASVFELCLASPSGYLQIPGRWCYRVVEDGETWPDPLLHRHHGHIVPEWGATCPMKWAVAPQRVDHRYQWTVHCLYDADDELSYTLEGLEYRHFRGINTSWKCDRTDQWHLDPDVHRHDEVLARDFRALGWLAESDKPSKTMHQVIKK